MTSAALSRLRPVHGERLHLGLMLALTLSTGVVDAVGYLGLDRVFVGNMTGNIAILGMGLTGVDGLPVVGPLVALAAFIAGAILAGAALRRVPSGWTREATLILGGVALLLAAALIPALLSPPEKPMLPMLTATAFMGVAMGAQAGVARHVAVADVTTVVVTSTLVAFAFDSRLGKNKPQRWFRRAAAVVALLLGALVGALLLKGGVAWGIGAAAVVVGGVALVGAVGRPEEKPAEA
ncbi:YoaK family protein [Microbacterium sp. X-17]|uniref:YoaK family protein n=1 Tax=Microbacterium sp. X-17 TaxID=3144404 RepID=UPI0031F52BC5